jgi:hypothetical protein
VVVLPVKDGVPLAAGDHVAVREEGEGWAIANPAAMLA